MNWSTRLRRWVRIRIAAGARGLDEADRGDRLAGAGRVLEPEAPARRPGPRAPRRPGPRRRPRAPPSPAAPRRGRARRPRRASSSAAPLPFVALAVGLAVGPGAVAAVRPAVRSGALELGDDRGQRAGERVDLVLVELGPVEQARLLLVEQPLEPEHQRVVAAPLEARYLGAVVELGQGGVDGQAPGGARGRGRRSSRRRAGSAHGKTPAPDRGRPQLSSPAALAATSVVLAIGKGKQSRARRLIQVGDGERSKLGRRGRRAEIPSGRTDVPPRSKNCGTGTY